MQVDSKTWDLGETLLCGITGIMCLIIQGFFVLHIFKLLTCINTVGSVIVFRPTIFISVPRVLNRVYDKVGIKYVCLLAKDN